MITQRVAATLMPGGTSASVAQAVGADPEPLIREYNTTRPVPQPITNDIPSRSHGSGCAAASRLTGSRCRCWYSSVSPWHTDQYATARFRNLHAGTRLLLDVGRACGDNHGRLGHARPGSRRQLPVARRRRTRLGRPATRRASGQQGGVVHLRLPTPSARPLRAHLVHLTPESTTTGRGRLMQRRDCLLAPYGTSSAS